MGATSLAISGGILTLVLIAMRVTSVKKFRRAYFEVFYYVHNLGFVCFYIGLVLHGSHNGVLKSWMYVTVPLIIFVVDRIIRLRNEHSAQGTLDTDSINIKTPGIVYLRLPRLFEFKAGQYCDIRVPEISSLQWHPFTIASSPHESEMRFCIKVNGDWTKSLHQLFVQRKNDDRIAVDLRGPYGAPAQHVGQYEHVVLISGGVGATPMASIVKHVHYWITNFTIRGSKMSTSIPGSFTINQSVQRPPRVSAAATCNLSSMERSLNQSRTIPRDSQRCNTYSNLMPNVGGDPGLAEGLTTTADSVDAPTSTHVIIPIASAHTWSEAEPNDEGNEYNRPDGYDEELGNPSLSIPDRYIKNVKSYQDTGTSHCGNAMMRHMDALDATKIQSSLTRTSAKMMNDLLEASTWADRILFYLHTVTVNWVMLWLMMLRFTLVFVSLPINTFSFSHTGLGVFKSKGMNIADLVIAVIITVIVFGAVVMEMVGPRMRRFISDNIADLFDLFVLLPLLAFCIVVHSIHLAGIGGGTRLMPLMIVLAVWPTILILIVWRIARTIGSRVVLAPGYRSSHAQTRSVDYICVGRTADDDKWLIDELLSVADSPFVRLHRYLTREKAMVEDWQMDYERLPLKTTYGRPDWDEIFTSLIERSRSGVQIGVFFCGPDAMGRSVQQAAMHAMAKSMDNARTRGYFTKKKATAAPNMPSSQRDIVAGGHSADPVEFGCAVTVVLRVENFT